MKRNHMNVLCLLIIALCYINSSEANECSTYIGPSGARQCLKLYGYIDYQWTTCHTDAYIRSRTAHGTAAEIRTIYIACTSACWKSTAERLALFTAVADVPLVKIQRRKMKSTLLYLLFLWLSALCSYLKYCTVKWLLAKTFSNHITNMHIYWIVATIRYVI